MTELEEKAIKCSINGNWKEAVKINLLILKKNAKDIDALNRLSYAYLQLGKIILAKKTAAKSLKVDPFNLIARKNINLLSGFARHGNKPAECLEDNVNFIENPGTTKLVSLICPAAKSVLSKIRNGSELNYKIRRRKICVSHKDAYIGSFPDDLSRKYITRISDGTKYEIFFKSYNTKKISVLLKEIDSKS